MVCHVIMDVTVVTEIEVFLSKKKAAPKEFEPGRPDHRSNAPPTDLWTLTLVTLHTESNLSSEKNYNDVIASVVRFCF